MVFRNNEGYYDPTAGQAIKNMEDERMEVKRGDIYMIEKAGGAAGSEQQAGRPAVIVSNDTGNRFSPVVEIVYLTTQPKNDLPTHTQIVAKQKSTALCEQVQTVYKDRLMEFVKCCTEKEMAEIDKCLMIALGLEQKEALSPAVKVEGNPNMDTVKLQVEVEIYKNLYREMLERVAGA